MLAPLVRYGLRKYFPLTGFLTRASVLFNNISEKNSSNKYNNFTFVVVIAVITISNKLT